MSRVRTRKTAKAMKEIEDEIQRPTEEEYWASEKGRDSWGVLHSETLGDGTENKKSAESHCIIWGLRAEEAKCFAEIGNMLLGKEVSDGTIKKFLTAIPRPACDLRSEDGRTVSVPDDMPLGTDAHFLVVELPKFDDAIADANATRLERARKSLVNALNKALAPLTPSKALATKQAQELALYARQVVKEAGSKEKTFDEIVEEMPPPCFKDKWTTDLQPSVQEIMVHQLGINAKFAKIRSVWKHLLDQVNDAMLELPTSFLIKKTYPVYLYPPGTLVEAITSQHNVNVKSASPSDSMDIESSSGSSGSGGEAEAQEEEEEEEAQDFTD